MAWWGWLATFAVGIAVAYLTYEWGRPEPALPATSKKPVVAVTRQWDEYLPKTDPSKAEEKPEPVDEETTQGETLTQDEQQAALTGGDIAEEDAAGAEDVPPPADDVAERFSYDIQHTPTATAEEEVDTVTPAADAELSLLKEEIRTLKERVAALEKEKEVQGQAGSLYERLYRLRMKIEHGEKADEVIATLKDLPIQEEQKNLLVMLDDLNRQGVPPRSLLAREFSERANQFATAPEEGMNAAAEAESWLKKQIVIRKVGDTHQGTDDGSVVARAETFAKAGKIKEALAETDRLSAPGQRFFMGWRAAAERRLQADALVQQLEQSIAVMPRSAP